MLFQTYPTLIASSNHQFFWIEDNDVQLLSANQVQTLLRQKKCPLLCHRTHILSKLGSNHHSDSALSLDILEWVSFLYPTLVAPPTIAGIAKILGFENNVPQQDIKQASLQQAILLRNIADSIAENIPKHENFISLSQLKPKMTQAGWEWAQYIADPPKQNDAQNDTPNNPLHAWNHLPEWQNRPALPPQSHIAPEPKEIIAMLEQTIAERQHDMRQAQKNYSKDLSHIFQPPDEEQSPYSALLEAYTGTGKTLGYLIPALIYAQKNNASVWISTYTRNLQHQIYHEAKNLSKTHGANIVIRKGRENYLCLLNYQQAVDRHLLNPNRALIGLILISRWIAETKFGDMNGNDFPAWLEDLFSYQLIYELADKKYGCIHNLCPHYQKCFVESTKQNAKQAQLVITNHALALTESENASFTQKVKIMIFDEAHHLFQATDNFYALKFSGQETAQIKQWLGDDRISQSQKSFFRPPARGLRARLGSFASNKDMLPLLHMLSNALEFLPSQNWAQRILSHNPIGTTEQFLTELHDYAVNYNKKADPFYDVEAPLNPTPQKLSLNAQQLCDDLKNLSAPLTAIMLKLEEFMAQDQWKKSDIISLERIHKRLEYFCELLNAWHAMMLDLANHHHHPLYVDWLCVKRRQGKSYDFEFCRHALNPMQQFSQNLLKNLSGFAMSSATLFSHETIDDDVLAKDLQGISDLHAPFIARYTSDFDYHQQARILIVTDIKQNQERLNNAYLQLFLAANGSSLGLFTAVRRLKLTHQAILPALAAQHINLYAQHIDSYSVSNLVEIFKNDTRSCLLGTDSLRDGIDVPGIGLRQVILEKMPWPRPDILTSARQHYFGADYYERLVRFKLKQAFGRLIRHKDDKGVFVLLDSAFPSKMQNIFPENIIIKKAPLNDIIPDIQEFLK